LKTRLLFQPGVVVASVPYQMRSAMHLRAATLPAAGPVSGHAPAEHLEPAQHDQKLEQAKGTAPALNPLTAKPEELHAHEPRAEVSQASATPIAECLDHEVVDIAGTLRTVTLRPRGTSLTMEADLWDGTGHVTLIWLGRREIRGMRPGRKIVAHGRIARIKDERVMYNPSYELRPGPESQA